MPNERLTMRMIREVLGSTTLVNVAKKKLVSLCDARELSSPIT